MNKTDDGNFGQTYYFTFEGKENLDKTVELVYHRACELKLKKVLVFTSNGEGAFKLKDLIGKKRIEVFAVTFPYKKPFLIEGQDRTKQTVYAETSKKETRELLRKNGIHLIQGGMALQDIIMPGISYDIKLQTINRTLTLISGGLSLCLEAILMASDAGYVEQGEEVIAFSADTAIVATGCRKEWLFHPEYGLEIREIICKPRVLTITHKKG